LNFNFGATGAFSEDQLKIPIFLLFSGILSVHARLRKRETVREKKRSYSRAKIAQKGLDLRQREREQ
jgi:hypothetical protein